MEKEISVVASNVPMLPDRGQTEYKLKAIAEFQKVVHLHLAEGHDYGVIPGTQKPTLLKPGAEKIAKLLDLSDSYEMVGQVENWEKGFFAFTVRCRLVSMLTGQMWSEGLGECNSMESRYRFRWLFPSVMETEGRSKDGLLTRKVKTKTGWVSQYRVENDDPYSLVNTILKMAKKRALVDAALSAGRLSDLFTQDMEDRGPIPDQTEDEPKSASSAPVAQEEAKVAVSKNVNAPEPETIPSGHYKAVTYIISAEQQVLIGELAKAKGIKAGKEFDQVKRDAIGRVAPLSEMTEEEGSQIISHLKGIKEKADAK